MEWGWLGFSFVLKGVSSRVFIKMCFVGIWGRGFNGGEGRWCFLMVECVYRKIVCGCIWVVVFV